MKLAIHVWQLSMEGRHFVTRRHRFLSTRSQWTDYWYRTSQSGTAEMFFWLTNLTFHDTNILVSMSVCALPNGNCDSWYCWYCTTFELRNARMLKHVLSSLQRSHIADRICIHLTDCALLAHPHLALWVICRVIEHWKESFRYSQQERNRARFLRLFDIQIWKLC